MSTKIYDCNRSDWKVNGNMATHKSGFTVTAKTSPTDPSKISCNLDLSTMCDWGEDIDFELLVIQAGQLDIEDILTEAPEK